MTINGSGNSDMNDIVEFTNEVQDNVDNFVTPTNDEDIGVKEDDDDSIDFDDI